MNTNTNNNPALQSLGDGGNPPGPLASLSSPSSLPPAAPLRRIRCYTSEQLDLEMQLYPAKFGLPRKPGGLQPTIWRALERQEKRFLSADTWQDLIADPDQYALFREGFLQPSQSDGGAYASRVSCPVSRRTVPFTNDSPDLQTEHLKLETPLEPNFPRLDYAIARAFGFDPKIVDLAEIPRTRQIGSFSGLRIPVILTIHPDKYKFRGAVGQTAACLRDRFILLAPTAQYHDAHTQNMLKLANAFFFDLESYLTLRPGGAFKASKLAGELFSPCVPQPKDNEDDNLRQAFLLIQQLDKNSAGRKSKLTASRVFQLYCIENLSSGEIARRCGCSRTHVLERLQLINRKLGRKAAELRRYSSHFQDMEARMSDSRARKINRRSAMDEAYFNE